MDQSGLELLIHICEPDQVVNRDNDGMGNAAGFAYNVRKNGDIVITHHGRNATVLRGRQAERFLARLGTQDDQELMARVTGNYKRGNERS